MLHKIHLTRPIGVPQINGEDIKRSINMAGEEGRGILVKNCIRGWVYQMTYLMSISFFVCASWTMSRMHGGGVIGRRSYKEKGGIPVSFTIGKSC